MFRNSHANLVFNDTPGSKLIPQVFVYDTEDEAMNDAIKILNEGDYNHVIGLHTNYSVSADEKHVNPETPTATVENVAGVPIAKQKGRKKPDSEEDSGNGKKKKVA